jgi:hypothetical protein
MSTDEKKPPAGGAVDAGSSGVMRLLSKPLGNIARVEVNAALVEWESGDHTHLSFEVMRSDGAWEPLASVALEDCLAADIRSQLRQFPVFRLAWCGQVGEPSITPQRGVPEQASFVSSDATTRP